MPTVETSKLTTPNSPMYYLQTGDLAFFETFRGGMVPGRIIKVTKEYVLFRCNSARPGYGRGEILTLSPENARGNVHARNAVQFRKYGTYIVGNTYIS